MLKIFKYLKESKWSVLAIIALLVVQAYCDLALPQYTADIVDIGIGQKGIENAVPRRLGAETYAGLMSLMTQEERALMASAYGQENDDNYVFRGDKETEEALDECIGIPILILSAMRESGGMPGAGTAVGGTEGRRSGSQIRRHLRGSRKSPRRPVGLKPGAHGRPGAGAAGPGAGKPGGDRGDRHRPAGHAVPPGGI